MASLGGCFLVGQALARHTKHRHPIPPPRKVASIFSSARFGISAGTH